MKESGNQARPVIDLIRKISNPMGLDSFWIVIAEVLSVNEDERTCVVQPINDKSEAEIPNVSLCAEPNDGQILIPEVGSAVIVGRTEKFQPFIILTSDLAKYILYAESITFNGDKHGGIPIADEIAQQVNAAFNAMKTAIISAYTAQAGIDGSLGLNAFNAAINALQPINSVTLQNTKVKHGND